MSEHEASSKEDVPVEVPTTDSTVEPVVATKEDDNRIGKLKLAFLYVLIGGLVLSAIISVVAIIIGEFNSVMTKAILMTVSFVIHSIVALLVILADKNNQLGRDIIPTTFFATIIANMISSSLGLWEVLSGDMATRVFFVYAFVIGIAFIAEGLLRQMVKRPVTKALTYTSIALVLLQALVFIPWILFHDASWVTDMYYRIISALSILAVTSILITFIMRPVVVRQYPELAKASKPAPYSSGMVGVVVTLATFMSFIWLSGFVAFVVQASTYNANKGNRIETIEPRKDETKRYDDSRNQYPYSSGDSNNSYDNNYDNYQYNTPRSNL